MSRNRHSHASGQNVGRQPTLSPRSGDDTPLSQQLAQPLAGRKPSFPKSLDVGMVGRDCDDFVTQWGRRPHCVTKSSQSRIRSQRWASARHFIHDEPAVLKSSSTRLKSSSTRPEHQCPPPRLTCAKSRSTESHIPQRPTRRSDVNGGELGESPGPYFFHIDQPPHRCHVTIMADGEPDVDLQVERDAISISYTSSAARHELACVIFNVALNRETKWANNPGVFP
jgi:hypothetical protein